MNYLRQFEQPHELYILVYNNTHEDIIIEANTDKAEIKIFLMDVEIGCIVIGEMDEHHSEIHACMNAWPDFINDNEGMYEEEGIFFSQFFR
jgi:hypothetical protein